jgi:hypothetical protein
VAGSCRIAQGALSVIAGQRVLERCCTDQRNLGAPRVSAVAACSRIAWRGPGRMSSTRKTVCCRPSVGVLVSYFGGRRLEEERLIQRFLPALVPQISGARRGCMACCTPWLRVSRRRAVLGVATPIQIVVGRCPEFRRGAGLKEGNPRRERGVIKCKPGGRVEVPRIFSNDQPCQLSRTPRFICGNMSQGCEPGRK